MRDTFIEVQLHIEVHFEKYRFFLSLVYKFLPFSYREVQKLDIEAQIFGDFSSRVLIISLISSYQCFPRIEIRFPP